MDNKISLQVLFRNLPQLSADMLKAIGARASAPLAQVDYQLPADTTVDGTGSAAFDNHKVRLDFCTRRLDSAAADSISAHVHCSEDVLELIAEHGAYIELTYEGQEGDPVANYVTLIALASLLTTQDALVIANCNGHSSVNAARILCTFAGKDWIATIQNMPVVYIICGAVPHTLDDGTLWLRTYGNHLLGIPDLGCAFQPGQEAEIVPVALETFDTLMGYMTATGMTIQPGHTMEGSSMMIGVKAQPPEADEAFQSLSGAMLRIELTPKSAVL